MAVHLSFIQLVEEQSEGFVTLQGLQICSAAFTIEISDELIVFYASVKNVANTKFFTLFTMPT